MSFNYAKLAATSLKLLTKFGRDVTYRQIGDAVYNSNTGTITPTETNITVKGADFDFKDKTSGNQFFTENIQENDRYILLQPSIAGGTVNDKIIIGTVLWNVINIKTLNPAGTPLLVIAHIRK